MVHRWDELAFLHWPYDPSDVQALLPRGLEVDTFDGAAWVGLVPFRLRIALRRGPSLPWMSRFAEMNVRTYVRGPDGGRGIWFLSLDAGRLGAVLVARATYGLPYFWSAMEIGRSGSVASYTCRRRWPAPKATDTSVAIQIGSRIEPADVDDLTDFLTSRWCFYSQRADGGLRRTDAEHAPWPLHGARVLHVHDGLVAAAGLPKPSSEPLVHWSPSVTVRIGPRR